MKVNPLMTVWLLSCVITYSGLTRANRHSSFKHEKKYYGPSELARIYGKGDSLASYKLSVLRHLSAEKKKKHKSSDSKTTTEVVDFDNSGVVSSTTAKHRKGAKTTTQAAGNIDNSGSALSSLSTSKYKKGTRKSKNHPTTNSQQGSDSIDSKNSNGNDNMMSNGGGNKWKKIQKFFFFPPNWSFNRSSYRAYGPTTGESKYKETSRQMELHSKGYAISAITDSTYLHPIPNITHDLYKDKLILKEELINKNTTVSENINNKEQINNMHSSNKPSSLQPNEFDKISSEIPNETDVVSKEPITQDERFIARNQEEMQDTVSSMGLTDKAEERTPAIQPYQQETILPSPYAKQEEITYRQELSESDKILPTEGGKIPPQDQPNEPEKEQIDPQENHYMNTVIYNYENTPLNNQIETVENINYDNRGTFYTNIFQTANTFAIDERQYQLRPEEITENIKDKYEVSMFREDPKLSFKPEATIELEQAPDKTSIGNPELPNNQKNEMTADKWKYFFNSNEPDIDQLRNLYSSINYHRSTEKERVTSRIHNTLDKIIKTNFNNVDERANETSDVFFKAFNDFFKGMPEIFSHHNVEKQLKTTIVQPMYDWGKFNPYEKRAKQHFFVNIETKLPNEMNSSNIQANEQKYHTLILDSILGKPTSDYLPLMEPKSLMKSDPLHNESTTTSSTDLKQYTIQMWPKYSDKTEYNTEASNTVNTESSAHSSNSTTQFELSSLSSHQNELDRTRPPDSTSTQITSGYHKPFEPSELPRQPARIETFLTIPILLPDFGVKTFLPVTEVPTTKYTVHQSDLNLTLHPMLFDNLWGIQSFLGQISNKPSSTVHDVFNDRIPFDNQHEFNADHHFQSTTLHPFFRNTINSEWQPFNIPLMKNDFEIINPTAFATQENKEEGDFTDNNEPEPEIVKQSEISMIEKNKMNSFTFLPQYISFSSEINSLNPFLFHPPLEKPEPLKKLNNYISHQNRLLNDSIWNDLMHQSRMEPSIKKISISEKLHDGNQLYQSDDLTNFLPFPKAILANSGSEDLSDFLVDPFLRNLKRMEFTISKPDSQTLDNNNDDFKSEIDEITTQAIENDLKIRNKLKHWNNLDGASRPEIEEFKEITYKYRTSKTELDDEFDQITIIPSLMKSEGNNVDKINGNKFESEPIDNNEMLTNQPSISFQNEYKPITSSNDWYARNEQNEKLLASEKTFDRQLSKAEHGHDNFQKEINHDQLKNNLAFLKNFMNLSLPEMANSNDANKNEISAIQMSAIKIINKKPETLAQPSFDLLKKMIDKKSNNTDINREMSQMFVKMQDLAKKLGMKKILQKRGVADLENTFDGSWRNKCSVLQQKTEAIPFNYNIKMSPSILNRDKKRNIDSKKISDKWKYSMQSVIDKKNEERHSDFNISDKDIKPDSDSLLSNAENNDLKRSEIQHKLFEKFVGKDIDQSFINSDGSYEYDVNFITGNISKELKQNVGNKRMKSRELEFILDRNLPRLPLNKRQFIAYMTGMKNSGNPIVLDEEKHSQLSKAKLQNLIDRNVKKDKVVELTHKRSRKKQWGTHTFP